jgi:hypothetical protein
MSQPILRSLLLLAFGLIVLLGVAGGVQAHATQQSDAGGVTAVTLASYNVTPLNNAVRIAWSTGSELGTSGFRIKRGAPGGPFEYLNALGDDSSGIIYSTGDVAFGASYERTDDTVLNGQTWTYILIEVETNGYEVEPNDARRTVTVGVTPTNTPVGAQGNTPGSSSPTPPTTTTATATRGTAAATSPAQGTAAPTIQLSPTRMPFATITPNAANPTTASSLTAVPTRAPTTASNTTNVIGDSIARPTTAIANPTVEITARPDNVALAQGQADAAVAALPPAQDGYPAGATPTVDDAGVLPTVAPTAVAPGFAVIGSDQGYTGAPNNASAAAPTNNVRGTLFLWIGFIVALLIFITGVVGTLILYTRKTN